VAQILGYLRSSRTEDGLLINFGSEKFQIKKYILNERGSQGLLRDITALAWFAVGSLLLCRG